MRSSRQRLLAVGLGILLGTVGCGTSQQPAADAPRATGGTALAELQWPLPASAQAYGTIDGRRLMKDVNDIVAISHKSHDEGNQYWGRIAGTPSGTQALDWVETRFHQIGLELQRQDYDLPPVSLPTSWEVSVSAGGNVIQLGSAWPFTNSKGTPAGGLDLQAVWVGVGVEADFIGRDLRGNAAVIYSWPATGAGLHSAMETGAIRRAQELGAAAIVVMLALPGNVSSAAFGVGPNDRVPVFSVGLKDGMAVQELIARAAPGRPPRLRVRLDVKTTTGLKSWNVVGKLPGQTDENILVMAHVDAFFEGATDNAAGMAAMVALAEYYAKVPQAQRRRTMYFVATPAHHFQPGSFGAIWMHDNMQPFFAKTALILNCEHLASLWPQYWATDGVLTFNKTNALDAYRFFVNGSDRLKSIFTNDMAAFGVASYVEPLSVSFGEMVPIHKDAPSAHVIGRGVYFHTAMDSPDNLSAPGLEAVARAYARVIDDVNALDLKDLLPASSPTTSPVAR